MKNLLFRTQKRKKLIINFIMTIVLISIPSMKVFAFETFNSHKQIGGVGDYGNNTKYYYVTSSASNYSTAVDNAMYDWVHTTSRLGITTPISYRRTYTQSSSVMDVYAGYYNAVPYNSFYAWAEQIVSGNVVGPKTSNWNWTKIKINNNNSSGLTSSEKKGAVAHEMGHCFGLAHNLLASTLMYKYYDFSILSSQPDECNGINYLY